MAGADDEVGRATDHTEIVVAVDLDDVAEVHPTVGPEQLRVGVGVAVVAGCDPRAFACTPADTGGRDVVVVVVEEANVHLGEDAPGGTQSLVDGVVDGRATHATGFVRSVELEDLGIGAALELGRRLERHLLATALDDSQR